jgi:hypothetical protein
MVGARTAVKQQHYRLFSHDWAVRDEAGTIDVEKQTNAIYGYIHDEETLTLGLENSEMAEIALLQMCIVLSKTEFWRVESVS